MLNLLLKKFKKSKNLNNLDARNWIQIPDWSWAHKKYSFELDHKLDSILSIDINPTRLIADTDESNNIFMSNNDE